MAAPTYTLGTNSLSNVSLAAGKNAAALIDLSTEQRHATQPGQKPTKDFPMVTESWRFYACLGAITLTSLTPHPAYWGIVALYVVGDERVRNRIGRMMARKPRHVEPVVRPPVDGEGYPLAD
jgi:hypothetical protein